MDRHRADRQQVDRSMTRYKYDIGKMVENNEITTGPGRYALGLPNHFGNAAFITDPTIRMQKWGASHDMSSTKTDVESDLRNLSRPSTKSSCGHETTARTLTPMTEASFPQTHARLVDPPCTLRGTGWNRWEWLCQNPQENVMMPFEWGVQSRYAAKDGYSPHSSTSRTAPPPHESAVPVARHPGKGDVRNFTDEIPGTSQHTTIPPPSLRTGHPRGGPQTGKTHEDAVPMYPVSNPIDRAHATTGILSTPAWFSSA
jgi:hypothetical protein